MNMNWNVYYFVINRLQLHRLCLWSNRNRKDPHHGRQDRNWSSHWQGSPSWNNSKGSQFSFWQSPQIRRHWMECQSLLFGVIQRRNLWFAQWSRWSHQIKVKKTPAKWCQNLFIYIPPYFEFLKCNKLCSEKSFFSIK